MKKSLMLAVAMVFAAGAALAADPLEGTWRTAPDDNGNSGLIEVKPCGTSFCGVLVKSFDPNGKEMKSPNVGKRIIWDMEAQGGGKYAGGKIWSPDKDKTYSSKLNLNGDTLGVKGCIFIVCRDGGQWSRVK